MTLENSREPWYARYSEKWKGDKPHLMRVYNAHHGVVQWLCTARYCVGYCPAGLNHAMKCAFTQWHDHRTMIETGYHPRFA